MVDFGGWMMPVQYTSIMDEHRTVRQAVGVFDISHMGEVFVSGPRALPWLNRLFTNNVERIEPGSSQYTFMLNEQGGVIDDLLIYHHAPGEYLLIVNASKIGEDVAWLERHLEEGVELHNRSDDYAGLAIQGPKAAALFERVFPGETLPARNRIASVPFQGQSLFVARTGYTGEDGFELFFPSGPVEAVWRELLEKGATLGVKPAGLGARDSLRLEMCYPLNGSDLSPERTPLEAGMAFFVDLAKDDFIGKSRLDAQKRDGLPARLVPFRMLGKTPPPRAHYPVYHNGVEVSETTSAGLSPSLETGIGLAYLPPECAKAGEKIEIDIRGRRFEAVIEKKPLYRKEA